MKHLTEFRRCDLTRQYDFLFGYIIDKHRDGFVQTTLAPAYVAVETAVEKCNEVVLTQRADRYELLSWHRSDAHVVHVTDSDPLLDLPW